jgi:hypothetical protein
LFNPDLETLREDVTILTYNYDPYLEFLLRRALEYRRMIKRRGKGPFLSAEDMAMDSKHNMMLNAVTSGFSDPENLSWAGDENSKPSFCVLKLHGSICSPAETLTGFETIFSNDPVDRATKLFSEKAVPPIVFPWEIMTEQGFAGKDSFLFQNNKILYSLFYGIWTRARREVQAADKISFVGLSLHQFLLDGLKYLFEGKTGDVEVCVANPDNTAFIPGNTHTHWNNLPNSPAHTVSQITKAVALNMKRWGSVPTMPRSDGDITLVRDFSEFIRTQMKPFGVP